MPSWMWILIFLLAITVIVIGVLWSSGVLAESERTRDGSNAIGGDADDDRASELTERDGGEPSRQMAPRRPGAIPPPALAGPAYGQSGGGASLSVPARRSAPPPAASAGSAASASAEGAVPRKRSSAPPPVQAAWSTPDKTSDRKPD